MTITCVTFCGVTFLISASRRSASAGEPSASTTTTPAEVTMKPALEMKLALAGEPSADRPSTYQQPGAASRAVISGGAACAPASE